MSLLDAIKPFLKDDANISDLEDILKKETAFSADKVKEWVAMEENKPVFDSIAGKAIASHIEKEKIARAEWEKKRASELLQEAKDKITKESQKSPEMLKIEELEAKLAAERSEKEMASLRAKLFDVVKSDKLTVAKVDPFLQYGEDAENELRLFAKSNSELIEAAVKKQIAEKFGNGDMNGGGNNKVDDKPIPVTDFLKESGITT